MIEPVVRVEFNSQRGHFGIGEMNNVLTYSILAGIAIVIVFVIFKAALRWTFKVVVVVLALAALAGGTLWWFSNSDQRTQNKLVPNPGNRANPNRR
jgi:energy-coupling factor transporter transmembrane protein EcfT